MDDIKGNAMRHIFSLLLNGRILFRQSIYPQNVIPLLKENMQNIIKIKKYDLYIKNLINIDMQSKITHNI